MYQVRSQVMREAFSLLKSKQCVCIAKIMFLLMLFNDSVSDIMSIRAD